VKRKKYLRKNAPPFQKIAHKRKLIQAWHQVRSNGLKSTSKDTRASINEYEKDLDRNLDRLSRKLLYEKFVFPPAKAVLQKRKRPLVIPEVESRIVQRRILDILQEHSAIKPYLQVPTSFGAIKNKGVPLAIAAARKAIEKGATHYYKSDIKKFFTQIPRKSVIEKISTHIKDVKFIEILTEATNLEIFNLESIPHDKRHYFNFDLVGTPQGCCLSPLLGNILLYEFDHVMNEGDITCLRYLDDFILLGPSERAVKAAYTRGKTFLKKLDLDAYDATEDPEKAAIGQTQSFSYLGVQFDGKFLRPSDSSAQKLIRDLENILKQSKSFGISDPLESPNDQFSLLGVLTQCHNKIKGWGNQYYFCNDEKFMRRVDRRISQMLEEYRDSYQKRRRVQSEDETKRFVRQRRLLGVHLLEDSNRRDLPDFSF
jgi:retron-type reverse transcriptase